MTVFGGCLSTIIVGLNRRANIPFPTGFLMVFRFVYQVTPPKKIINKFGADTARLFMLSDSPPEKDLEWTDTGIKGAYKYLNRLWDLVTKNLNILLKEKKDAVFFLKSVSTKQTE